MQNHLDEKETVATDNAEVAAENNIDQLPPVTGTPEWKQLYAMIANYARKINAPNQLHK